MSIDMHHKLQLLTLSSFVDYDLQKTCQQWKIIFRFLFIVLFD